MPSDELTDNTVLDDPLLPQGDSSIEMFKEHRDEGHPTEPAELANAAKCPLCYLEGVNYEAR